VYERSLIEAELILNTQKESLVPVQKLWEEIVKRSEIKGFEVASLPDFSAMLEGDSRFQIIPAQIRNQEEEEGSAVEGLVDMEMENLGFFSEDRVKLRASRVVDAVINEDEEEVGSIRRRAFVSQTVKAKKNDVKKKAVASSNKSKKSQKKKTSLKKKKAVTRKKPAKSTKLKKTRGKK